MNAGRFARSAAIGAVLLLAGALAGLAMAGTIFPVRRDAQIVGYTASSDGHVISVRVWIGRLESIGVRGVVAEDESSVTVYVRLLDWPGTVPSDVFPVDLPLTLSRPIGDRRVVDTRGTVIPRASPAP